MTFGFARMEKIFKTNRRKKKMAKNQKSGSKPLDKLIQGNIEVLVWVHTGKGGKPFRTYSLLRYVPDYQAKTKTWQDIHGFSSADLRDLKQLISDALAQELAAGGEE